MCRRWRLLGLLWLLVIGCASARAEVTASVDRSELAPGETVQLMLQRDGRGGDNPELTVLQRDFDVLGSRTHSSMSFVNGQMRVETLIVLTLSPKRSGTLSIPPIRWNGEYSKPLMVKVAGSAKTPGRAVADHVFMRSELQPESPYLQSAAVLVLRLYTDQPLLQASLQAPEGEGLLIEPFGQDRQTVESVDGRRYTVVERRYLVTPQRSGRLTLDGAVLDAQVADRDIGRAFGGLMNRSSPIRLRADALSIDVLPRPPGWTDPDWLPAESVQLEERWTPAAGPHRVGDPIVRTLSLTAVGASVAQLPDLSLRLQLPPGLRSHADAPQLGTDIQNGKPLASRTQRMALLANQAGQYTLPALQLQWWDSREHRLRHAELPERSIEVLPALGSSVVVAPPPLVEPAPARSPPQLGEPPAPVAADTAAGQRAWRGMPYLAAALLLALLLAAGWRLRRRMGKPSTRSQQHKRPSARRAHQSFAAACAADDPAAARRALLDWARAMDPQAPSGLLALAQAQGDAQLSALIVDLDRACHTGQPWRGAALARRLQTLPRHPRRRPLRKALDPLYR